MNCIGEKAVCIINTQKMLVRLLNIIFAHLFSYLYLSVIPFLYLYLGNKENIYLYRRNNYPNLYQNKGNTYKVI